VYPLTLALARGLLRPPRAARAIALSAGAFGLGTMAGFAVGGLLAQYASWRLHTGHSRLHNGPSGAMPPSGPQAHGCGAIPALAVFWLRRRIRETPRFLLAQAEARETAQRAILSGRPAGLKGVLAQRQLLRWLVGASLAWLLFDFVYYGNTIASPMITQLVAPHATLIGATTVTLAIFAVAALPGYLLAAFTIDKIGRRLMQATGFAVMAAAFLGLWLIPGASTTLLPFLLLFGATYFFAEFGPNTTTFVYPAEIFPVWVRTTSHGIAAACGKLGAFAGTYALTALLPVIGFSKTSALVAGVSVLGLLVTVGLLPEPKGISLEELTEINLPGSAAAVPSAVDQYTRIPRA
jgi:MFS transporter, PHS family, inorganic phosphate transporter